MELTTVANIVILVLVSAEDRTSSALTDHHDRLVKSQSVSRAAAKALEARARPCALIFLSPTLGNRARILLKLSAL